jgi:glycosyltransferase involved in cell wall biosynthesis
MGNDYSDDIELSIVMPCLNEAETVKICIDKAKRYLAENHIKGEIVIGDNGSTDGSQKIIQECGVRLIEVSDRGYGSALMGAFRTARGRYIVMGDADDSYDFNHLSPFIDKLREGYDLIIGNRFTGEIKPNAMPMINKYLGNPVLSSIARLFFRSKIGDFHCGLRGFRREALIALDLKTTGMEFASEMIVAATIHHLKITEVPVVLSPDGRGRPSHLRPWRDGWRHLRFLLSHSPGPVFLIRELLLMVGGLIRRFVGLFRFSAK